MPAGPGRRPTTRSAMRRSKLGEYAWFADNADKKTHPVGQKKPNPWGLFDMHGNVAEWCQDVYDKDYYKSSPDQNPRGPADGKEYVLRGGSWKSTADALRSSYRLGRRRASPMRAWPATPSAFDACGRRRPRKNNSLFSRPSRTAGRPGLRYSSADSPGNPEADSADDQSTPFTPTMLFHTWVFFVFFLIVYPGLSAGSQEQPAMNIWLMIASYTFYGWWNPGICCCSSAPRPSITGWSC